MSNTQLSWSLIVRSGPSAGHVFPIQPGLQTIGRLPDNHISISGSDTSGRHAQITLQPEGCWISDLGSTKGTFVNGQRITTSTWLKPGDAVQIGATVTLSVNADRQVAPVQRVQTERLSVPGAAAPSQAFPTTSLVVQRGPQMGQTFALHSGINTIGRASDNNIILPDGSVSHHHARITVRPEGVWVEDLGSTNGTFVNGQQITASTWLKAGDRVQVGGAVILGVQVVPAAAHVSPAAPAFPVAPPPVMAPSAMPPTAAVPAAEPRRRRRVGVWLAGLVGVFLCLLVLAAGAWFYFRPGTEVAAALSPIVLLKDPTQGAAALVNYPLLVSAQARDLAGIKRVELWVDGVFVGAQLNDLASESPTYDFVANWMPTDTGLHDLFVRAYSPDGRVGQSNIVTFFAQPIMYEAVAGDTLETIAEDVGATVEEIKEVNPELRSPEPGSEVLITGCQANAVYTIRTGETVANIAETFGLREEDVLQANPGLSPTPPSGTKVQLHNVPLNITYRVQPGDNWLLVAALWDNEICGPQSVDQELVDWIIADGYRDPIPGEMIHLPDVSSDVDTDTEFADTGLADTGLTDTGDLPDQVTDVIVEDKSDCTAVQLKWTPPSTTFQQYRVYGRAPGSAVMTQLVELGVSSINTIIETAFRGPWQFYVGTVNQLGLENLSRVQHDTSECGSQTETDALTKVLKIQLHTIKAPVSDLYCYLRAGGDAGLYERLPAKDGNFISPSVTVRHPIYGITGRTPLTYTLDLAWDPLMDLTVDFTCYGWAGGELIELGEGQVRHPPSEWDGRRITLDRGSLHVEYSIQPKRWDLISGRRLDPDFSAPFNLKQGPTQFVQVSGLPGAVPRDTLAWEWQAGPGQNSTSVAGFQVIMREYEEEIDDTPGMYREFILDEVFGSAVRFSQSWPTDDVRECGRWASLFVRAFGYGPLISDYSEPLTLEPIVCPVRGGRIAYGETVQGSIDDQYFYEEWIFTGKAGDQVTLEAETTSGDLAISMQILSGNSIVESRLPRGWGEYLPYRLPADGEYTIRVSRPIGATGTGQGSYSLHLDKLTTEFEVALAFKQIHVIRREDAVTDDDLFVVWAYLDSTGLYQTGHSEILRDMEDGETGWFDSTPFIPPRTLDGGFILGLQVWESEHFDAKLFNDRSVFAGKVVKFILEYVGYCPTWESWVKGAKFFDNAAANQAAGETIDLGVDIGDVKKPCDYFHEGAVLLNSKIIGLDKNDLLGEVTLVCQLDGPNSDGGFVCTATSDKDGSHMWLESTSLVPAKNLFTAALGMQGGSVDRFNLIGPTDVAMSYSGETWGLTGYDFGTGACGKLASDKGRAASILHDIGCSFGTSVGVVVDTVKGENAFRHDYGGIVTIYVDVEDVTGRQR